MTAVFNKRYPKLFGHKDSLKDNNFFASRNFVINKNLEAFTNTCPHRGFPIIAPGTVNNEMRCELHGWQWDSNGQPHNNSACLKPRTITCGKSGLLFTDWEEPADARWVQDLANDNFTYSHSTKRTGTGDWRWQMEMHVDLLHVDKIHPLLTSYVDVNKLETEYGTDWICQRHEHGWWLFVYPFTHIEWEPGCLYFSEMTPTDSGYDMDIHYMFGDVAQHTRNNFISIAEVTIDEDIDAVNRLSANSKYRSPPAKLDPLEVDLRHFYSWVKQNTN